MKWKARSALKIILRVVALCIPMALMVSANAQHGAGPPGTTGKTILNMGKGTTTWWVDIGDGVDPGVAGCHVEVTDRSGKQRTGRFVGESCRGNILVETTPGRGQVHDHPKDIGHPLLIDCNQWCQRAQNRKGGVCRQVQGPAPCNTSAVCTCN